MLTKKQFVFKHTFDIIISMILLPFVIVLLILLLPIALISAGENGLFLQQRIGRFGRPFTLYKIRSLRGIGHNNVIEIKNNETRFGAWLRKTKLDELPQLFNILKGNMSLVGPRPDIKGYADNLQGEDGIILSIKPGITGPATIKYRNEDSVLLNQSNPKKYNDEVIWPDKVAINKDYIKNWSFQKDLYYLFASVFK